MVQHIWWLASGHMQTMPWPFSIVLNNISTHFGINFANNFTNAILELNNGFRGIPVDAILQKTPQKSPRGSNLGTLTASQYPLLQRRHVPGTWCGSLRLLCGLWTRPVETTSGPHPVTPIPATKRSRSCHGTARRWWSAPSHGRFRRRRGRWRHHSKIRTKRWLFWVMCLLEDSRRIVASNFLTNLFTVSVFRLKCLP